jgi:hypothetical protein
MPGPALSGTGAVSGRPSALKYSVLMLYEM